MTVKSRLNKDGSENPDPTPLEIPAGFAEPESLESMIRRLVRSEDLRAAADKNDADTWEEAEDFIIPEDPDWDPSTPYEEVFDPQLGRGITPQEFIERADYYKKLYLEAEEKALKDMLKSDALRARPTRKGGDGGGASPRQGPPDSAPAVDKLSSPRDK